MDPELPMNQPSSLARLIRQQRTYFHIFLVVLLGAVIFVLARPLLVDAQQATPRPATAGDDESTFPFVWQGEATIPAEELAEVAPPLQAEISQGDFQPERSSP